MGSEFNVILKSHLGCMKNTDVSMNFA